MKDAEERSLQEAEASDEAAAGGEMAATGATPRQETTVDKVTAEELKIDTRQARSLSSPREPATPRDEPLSAYKLMLMPVLRHAVY